MTTQEIITVILAIGLLIIAVCSIFITYFFIKTLKSITSLVESLQSTAQNKFLSVIPALLIGLIGRIFKKRG